MKALGHRGLERTSAAVINSSQSPLKPLPVCGMASRLWLLNVNCSPVASVPKRLAWIVPRKSEQLASRCVEAITRMVRRAVDPTESVAGVCTKLDREFDWVSLSWRSEEKQQGGGKES